MWTNDFTQEAKSILTKESTNFYKVIVGTLGVHV